MTEIEKVIQALACSSYKNACKPDCPCEFRLMGYKANTTCDAIVAYKAMELLKKHTPVEPIFDDKSNRMLGVWKCGNCGMVMAAAATRVHYCWNCGHEVDFDAHIREKAAEAMK